MLLSPRYPPGKSEKMIPGSSPAHPQEKSWEEPVSDPWSLLEGKLLIPGEISLGKPQIPAVVGKKKKKPF